MMLIRRNTEICTRQKQRSYKGFKAIEKPYLSGHPKIGKNLFYKALKINL